MTLSFPGWTALALAWSLSACGSEPTLHATGGDGTPDDQTTDTASTDLGSPTGDLSESDLPSPAGASDAPADAPSDSINDALNDALVDGRHVDGGVDPTDLALNPDATSDLNLNPDPGPTDGGDVGAGDWIDEPDAGCANRPPETPFMASPSAGAVDIVPGDLFFSFSRYQDPDDDRHAATEVELWDERGGEADDLVWSARLDGESSLESAFLDDGLYAEDRTGLEEYKDYLVRVRYLDASTCSLPSEWSEYVPFRTEDGSNYLFDTTQVRTFELTIPPESWDLINAQAAPPGCVKFPRTYYTGSLTFEGVTFEGVGIHIKGGCGSWRDLDRKSGFRVNLEWDDAALEGCAEDRRLHGQRSFTFNNEVQDRTAIHERLGYPLFAAMGIPAPRIVAVRINVNGEYWGLYNMLETFDRRLLSRFFESSDGMMYEGAYWCDLTPDRVPASADDDDTCFDREFSTDACDEPNPEREATDWEPLRQLTEQIAALEEDAFYPEVEAFMDFDEILRLWAVEGAIAHWDGYSFGIVNNYRVYHDPTTGLWSMMSSGIDQTFGGDLDPFDSVSAVLTSRCNAEPDCQEAFAARLDLAAQTMAELNLGSLAATYAVQIRPHLEEDPRYEWNMQEFDRGVSDAIDWVDARPGRIEQILDDHGY